MMQSLGGVLALHPALSISCCVAEVLNVQDGYAGNAWAYRK